MYFKDLEKFLNDYFKIDQFKDYCPNGLQVQGSRVDINKVITGVTASQALIDKAIEKHADAIIVHHGYFWEGENKSIVNIKYQRLAKLIKNGIYLFGYHLPLDAHKDIGNNILLAKKLNLSDPIFFNTGSDPNIAIIVKCHLDLNNLNQLIEKKLNRKPMLIKANAQNKRIAICTGSAQDFIGYAQLAGADTFISGEITERTTHLARELGINYIAAGHHATEQEGIKAVTKLINNKFQIDCEFIDIHNPA